MYALILDDSELNNLLMEEALRGLDDCTPVSFTAPGGALRFIEGNEPEIGVIISDYEMPGMNGIAFVRAVRGTPGCGDIPIVMVTSFDQRELRREALRAGASEFLGKPFDPVEIRVRVQNLLALRRARLEERNRADWLAREVEKAVATIEARERETITQLMKAAEFRDSDTGNHIARVSGYVGLIAAALGLDAKDSQLLSLASTMHDIGKIGVPDRILLKPEQLTPEERQEMQDHAARGRAILEGSGSEVARLGAEIAASHHEWWDGSGYPNGLAGEAIPLSGRIVAIADVFDALTSARPYKDAWSLDRARTYIIAGSGCQFDPTCVAAFQMAWPQISDLRRKLADPDETAFIDGQGGAQRNAG